MRHSDVVAGRGLGEAGDRSRVNAHAGFQEIPAERRQQSSIGIERLLGPRQGPQGAVDLAHIAPGRQGGAKLSEGGHGLVARLGQRLAQGEVLRRPIRHVGQGGGERRVRLADRIQNACEIRRVQIPRDQTQRLEGAQERRQRGGEVVERPVFHAASVVRAGRARQTQP